MTGSYNIATPLPSKWFLLYYTMARWRAILNRSIVSDSLQPMDWNLLGRLLCPWEFSRQEYCSGLPSLFQGILPTRGSNPGLLKCRQILYWLSHQGSQRILKWVAYPFSSGSSQPRNWTRVSCIAGRFFTSWATREAQSESVSRSAVADFLQNVVCQVPLSMEFSRQEYWSGWVSSRPRNRTQVFYITGRFFTIWATRKGPGKVIPPNI